MEESVSRRDFLYHLAGLAAGALYLPMAKAETVWEKPREIWMWRKQTKEEANVVYWAGNQMVADGYIELCKLLRDVDAKKTVRMDMVLLDILYGIQQWFALAGQARRIDITSGYRSTTTNAHTEGAARNSQHLLGAAADLKIEGVPMEYLGQLALYLQGGGVGFYQDGHIHVDKGRVRVWRK